jgi:hypothetical protein
VPDDPPTLDRQALIQVLTTEHFTLQGARSSAVAETNSRLQIYMAVLSSSILGLALVAQFSREAFFAFAFVLLPMVYVFGLATGTRLRQSWLEWFIAGQGMARIRRFFVDTAPEAERYLILPTTDQPWAVLGGTGIKEGNLWRGLVTAAGVVAMINSVAAGVLAGLVATRVSSGHVLLTAASGGGVFLISLAVLMGTGRRTIFRYIAAADVRFPSGTEPRS